MDRNTLEGYCQIQAHVIGTECQLFGVDKVGQISVPDKPISLCLCSHVLWTNGPIQRQVGTQVMFNRVSVGRSQGPCQLEYSAGRHEFIHVDRKNIISMKQRYKIYCTE